MSTVVVDRIDVDYKLNSSLLHTRTMRAVSDVSFELIQGQALALVGESGSGKSTCARAIARLTAIASGSIKLNGQDINDRSFSRAQYARHVQMIFQDPFGSLNPVHTILHHLARPIAIHNPKLSATEVNEQVEALLDRVGLNPASEMAQKYPHEMSGGQRQRVAIARALAVGAEVILADEPISMLDVSIRLGILNLLEDMKQDGIAFLYITHDIASAAYIAERTAVMYVGHMVEWGGSEVVTTNPQHPYTQLLIDSIPDPARSKAKVRFRSGHRRVRGVHFSAVVHWHPVNVNTPCRQQSR